VNQVPAALRFFSWLDSFSMRSRHWILFATVYGRRNAVNAYAPITPMLMQLPAAADCSLGVGAHQVADALQVAGALS
jgi:hypothetical protein